MLGPRTLRPLARGARVAHVRFNSSAPGRLPSQRVPETEGNDAGTLLLLGASALALVAAGYTSLDLRSTRVHGYGEEAKEKVEGATERVQEQVERARQATEEKAGEATEAAKDAAGRVQSKVADATASARETASSAAAKVQDAAAAAKEKVQDATESAREKMHDATAAIKDKVEDATAAAKAKVSEVTSSAEDTKEAALERMRKAAEPLAGLPGADTVIADLMAQAEKALEGWTPSEKTK